MEDRSHALIAIIFLVVFGVGAVLIVWWIVTPGAVRVPYVLEAKSSVAGLGQGSVVQFDGVKIGVVKSIRINPRTHRSIRVKIAIDKNFPLPNGTYATAGSSGLVGPSVVNMHLGKGPGIIHTSAANPAHIRIKQGGLSAMMNEAGEIMSKAKQTLDSVQKIASQKNAERVTATLENIKQASAKLVVLEKDIAPAAQRAPQLIAQVQSTLSAAHRVLIQADKLVASARQPVRRIGAAASAAAGLAMQLNQSTAPQLNALMRRLRTLSGRLQALIDTLQRTPQSLIKGPARKLAGPGETRGTPQRSHGGG
ncbi:MAG: MlaD family protein [Gammaproteobacteria bacterium]